MIVVLGKGDLRNITLSLSTVTRIRNKVRQCAGVSVSAADFDPFLTIHFDGKKCKMGSKQGGQTVEHIPVIVSGVSGERQLGISIAESASGKNNQ